jgi:hypothetical protein
MEHVLGSLFGFLKDNLDTVLGIIVGGGGVLGMFAKFVAKVPFFRLNKWSKVIKEFGDFANEVGKATDEKGDGGKDITEKEWGKMFKEGRGFIKALCSIRK